MRSIQLSQVMFPQTINLFFKDCVKILSSYSPGCIPDDTWFRNAENDINVSTECDFIECVFVAYPDDRCAVLMIRKPQHTANFKTVSCWGKALVNHG